MRPTRLVDPAARLRLEAAVLEAERRTAGEIVLCVVRASDEYGSAGWRLAAALAALALLGAALFLGVTSPGLLLCAQGAAGLGGHALARIPAVRRLLIDDTLAETRVAQRARLAFAERGLERTRGRTGILLFVSLLERRVVVLGDVGVDRILAPDERWDDVVQLALRGLREGRAVEGLAAAIARCGEILAAHLPAPPRDVNELPDAVVLED
jgi:putative membrane protein